MKPPIAYKVTAPSNDIFCVAKSLAAKNTALDFVDSEDIGVSWHYGVPKQFTCQYCVGDFFKKVEIIDQTDTTFKVVFHLRSDAASYWKDIIVRLIRAIRNVGAEIDLLKK